MITIWTDGSCIGNPGPGGWAVYRDDGPSITGGEDNTTNNRMELQAIIEALQSVSIKEDLAIWSDSQWAINMALGLWKATKNIDMVFKARSLIALREASTKIKWVRGHDKSPQNEMADSLAYQEAESRSRRFN